MPTLAVTDAPQASPSPNPSLSLFTGELPSQTQSSCNEYCERLALAGEHCFWDLLCSDATSTHHGCNAGGIANCRYCGIPPGRSTPNEHDFPCPGSPSSPLPTSLVTTTTTQSPPPPRPLAESSPPPPIDIVGSTSLNAVEVASGATGWVLPLLLVAGAIGIIVLVLYKWCNKASREEDVRGSRRGRREIAMGGLVERDYDDNDW